MVFLYIISYCLFSCFSLFPDTLDNIAIACGTDKSSKWHRYTPIYEKYFNNLKNNEIKLLEIGFYQGSSAHLWDRYFTKGTLYFIDVDQKCYSYMKKLSKRCQLDMVDQANKQALLNYVNKVGGNFDIIIDDGGHTMGQQITSFETLFPYLKSGGVYVIEDLHTSYRESFGGSSKITAYDNSARTTINFLKNLIDDLNYIGQKNWCADHQKCPPALWKTLSYYQKFIQSMHFYDSLVLIFKS